MTRDTLNLGIDEAGRGCVLGPLVLACVAASARDRARFSRWHVRDSKIIPPDERTWLAEKIMQSHWHRIRIVPATEIDRAVSDRRRTLNGLEREQMVNLLVEAHTELSDSPLRAIVDCPSINHARFTQQLIEETSWQEPHSLIAVHHADARFMAVAAASIVAKHVREQEIARLKQELGIDFGCGYPHDPLTTQYLAMCERGAAHVRWTWSTANRYNQRG